MSGAPELPDLTYVEELGSGGFSDVYLYEREHPRMKVAIKLLRSSGLDAAQLQQFRDEANVMAELEHPYIVPVLGAGTAPDGRPYLMMRYYPPPDLGKRVVRQQLSVPEALRTGIQLASAVETAHRSGIIHRDIKPANVLVSRAGDPGLSDFGIAGRGQQTENEDYVGVSMPWSPPEVLAGRSNGSAASDVYSLAATVWHLLVGRSPFSVPGDNSDRSVFSRILNTSPPKTGRADVPPGLDRLLQQAMAKNPAHRPASAIEFARLMQRIEQELRLARTDIVLLDVDPAEADLAPPEANDDADVTMLKRPVTVRPAAPVTPGAATDDADTELRRTPATTTEQTELRRAREAATPGPEANTPSADQNRKVPVAAAATAAAVLLATAVVVGVLLSGSGDAPPPNPGGQPDPSTAQEVIPGLSPLTEPELNAKVTGNDVTFTASGADDGTSYAWQVAVAGDAFAPVDVPPQRRSITVPIAQNGEVCARLMISKDGQSAGPYQVCETRP